MASLTTAAGLGAGGSPPAPTPARCARRPACSAASISRSVTGRTCVARRLARRSAA